MALGRKTGGRKKGSKNKHKAVAELMSDVVVQAAQSGETPLEYILRVMRDPAQDAPRRDEMAKAAAPYVHAKLAATDVKHSGSVVTPDNRSADELMAEILAEVVELGILPESGVFPGPSEVGNGGGYGTAAAGKSLLEGVHSAPVYV
jgi:hypothetical protein